MKIDWITDRKPQEGENQWRSFMVSIYDDHGGGEVYEFVVEARFNFFHKIWIDPNDASPIEDGLRKVTAWAEMPEPYKP